MTDDDLERLLQRYRPAGPGESLRARVVDQPPRRRTVAWLSAVAVLALAISLHLLASRTYDDIATTLDASRAAEENGLVTMIAADLADVGIAREMARRLVMDRERRQAQADAPARARGEEDLWTQ